jgi:hypothetical protein
VRKSMRVGSPRLRRSLQTTVVSLPTARSDAERTLRGVPYCLAVSAPRRVTFAPAIGVAFLSGSTSTSAAPSHSYGPMRVAELRPSGYSSERLFVSPKVLRCARGRKLVAAYYTSREEGQGSGAFRQLGAYSCGGGLSSLRGCVALLCEHPADSSNVVLELRVQPLAPPS